MGLFHRATITPSKPELVERFVRAAGLADPDETVSPIGSFRFDDPAGEVGMETHLVGVGERVVQVPLTYRDRERDDADDTLVGTTEHSVLGTRWVYDGVSDPVYLTMLAAVAMTGQGEALGMVEHDGRWTVCPANVRITGGGWSGQRVPVNEFVPTDSANAGDPIMLRNDGFELEFHRHPEPAERPPLGLTATWDGLDQPVLLAAVRPA